MIRCIVSLLWMMAVGIAQAQQTGSVPRIEPCDCAFKADTGFKTQCGYLVVPENRKKPYGKQIKLPFIKVESNNPNKHSDPVLYTGGGPGVSSLHPVTVIARRSETRDRDYIAFEQRGTHYAKPCLDCDSVGFAVQQAYIQHQPVDQAVTNAIKKCRAKLIANGIDLSAYNTDESAADIEDLRVALHIDSINLLGISYSGGLLMTVLKRYPEHIRSLILDSPLPEFINIDEQELANFNEALTAVLDSADSELTVRFRQYFTGLNDKTWMIAYPLKDGRQVNLQYGRAELLSIIHDKLENYEGISQLPMIVKDMIGGRQEGYVRTYFDGVFNSNSGVSGMRLSVYCSDKMAYSDPSIIQEQYSTMPWMSGFHVNDVYGPLCDCWAVKPIDSKTKLPFYSNVPVLLGAGGLDDACRPLYNDIIHHYFPNSQRVIFPKRLHGPLLNSQYGDDLIGQFLAQPWQKLVIHNKEAYSY